MSSFSVSSAFWQQAWPLVGWTMLWFLAAGTIVLIVGAILRVLFKRATSQVRYFTSLAGFAMLALLPIAIAGYLTTSLPRDITRSSRPGLDETTNFIELNPKFETKNQNDLKIRPEVSREAKRVGDERSAITETAIPGWNNRAMLNSILNAIVAYLPWLWLVGTPLTFLLLATGLIGAERLRKSCQTLTDGPILAACERVRTQLAIARQVGIAICDSVSSPLLIGVVKPLILLPPAALTGWTTEELEMVLLHELAHVRRWDNAVNLVQRIVESLLFFHPATWIMSNWVRRDREDCCDAIVVRQTAKPQAYAELLVALASHTPGLATSVAMAQHPIASRIRRILKIEDEPMLISRKGLTLGVGIVLATVLLAFALPASEAEEASLPRERGERAKVSREAERVADERSAEETTNLTNGTNKDLATENTDDVKEDFPGQRIQIIRQFEIPSKYQNDETWLPIQEILLKSNKTLSHSLTEELLALPLLKDAKPDPKVWLRQNLHVSKTNSGKRLTIAIDGRRIHENQLSKIIDAIADSYEKDSGNKKQHISIQSTIEHSRSSSQRPENTADLNAEAAETAKIAENPLFPTLEEQRAADFAYKLLGVELEKLSEEELERVKAKGYQGGLRVTQTKAIAENQLPRADSCHYGDLLVGLHVWPTQSLDQVQEILQRDDLDQLSPLKFYVIRGARTGGRGGGFAGGPPTGPDELVTGRIEVDLNAWRAMRELNTANPVLKIYDHVVVVAYDANEMIRTGKRVDVINDAYTINVDGTVDFGPTYGEVNIAGKTFGEAGNIIQKHLSNKIANCAVKVAPESLGLSFEAPPEYKPTPDPGPPPSTTRQPPLPGDRDDQSPLLYDGKTFDQWRDLWTTELKTEKRVECIKALAAFGRAGRGKEASEAILDVAAEFDFGNFEGSSAQDLKQAISQVLAGVEGIEGQHWLPQLMERLKSDPAKWNSFAEWVLKDARGKNVAPYLKQLARDPSLSVYARAGAIAGLASQQDIADDAESMTMVREVLTGDDAKMIPTLISNLNFSRLELFPEQAEFLIHKNDAIRNAAWGQFRRGFNPAQGVPFLELFLAMIDDPTRKEDHARAIEAIGLLNSRFANIAEMQKRQSEVVDKLTQLLIDGDVELLPAALLTRSKLRAQSVELLIRNLGDKISAERRQQLEEAAKKAEELEAQQNMPMDMRGGGMGGGGGGMF